MAKILVVDDRPIDREYLKTLLGYAGHDVVSAGDGEEALRLAAERRPDLAIVDIVMPTMDGLEFVHRVNADPRLAGFPVIFYSASFLRSEAMRLARFGHVGKVLTKPAEPEEILRAVAESLGTKPPKPSSPRPRVEPPDLEPLVAVTLRKSPRELQSLSQQFAMLVELAREFTSASDADKLLDRLAFAARAVVGAKYAVVALLDESGRRISRMYASGLGAGKKVSQPFPSAVEGLFADLLAQATAATRIAHRGGAEAFGLPVDLGRIGSALSAPIGPQTHRLGMLCLLDKSGGGEFTDDDLKITETLVAQVGIAFENVRLMAETRRRLEFVNALRAIDTAITASFDLRLTLSVVLEQVVSHLAVDAADIMLLNRTSNYLETVAGRGFRSTGALKRIVKLGESHAGTAALERRFFGFSGQTPQTDGNGQPVRVDGEVFEAYYVAPLLAKGRTLGVLEVFNRISIQATQEWLDFIVALAGQAAIAIDEASLFSDLQRANDDLMLAYDSTLEGWVHALDLRDKETEGHTQRVTELTCALARSDGFSDSEIVHVRRGALLHDIGKLGIPDAILLKPGALTDEEWTIMRRHPALAYEWLKPIAYLRPALDIPYCHHERWDGSGYPRGLAGESIPPAARLFTVVDRWDALTSDRSYRPAWPVEKADAHIRSLSGTHLDPAAVEAFFKLPGLGAVKPPNGSR